MKRPPDIRTPRLRLVAADADMLEMALRDPPTLEAVLDASIPEGWPQEDLADALPAMMEAMIRDLTRPGWSPWFVVKEPEGMLIGDVGFLAPPSPHVEIGYSILPPYRRQGYAAEAARALVQWAFDQGAPLVRATAERGNEASLRLLRRMGMRENDDGGPLVSFELPRQAWAAGPEGPSPPS